MKYVLVAIKDNGADYFQPIAQVRARGEAMRSFTDAVNNPQNQQIHQHPADFDLYLVGYFDDQLGQLEALATPERLARGIDVKAT